eukprot:jgi/Chrzof1/7882/Cz02g39270.t1
MLRAVLKMDNSKNVIDSDTGSTGSKFSTRQQARWGKLYHGQRTAILASIVVGLVLLGAGLALAVSLPVTLRKIAALSRTPTLLTGSRRTYYLAAEPIAWNYVPLGRDVCKDRDFTEEQQLYTEQGLGSVFKKAVFRAYTDSTFKVCLSDAETASLLATAVGLI